MRIFDMHDNVLERIDDSLGTLQNDKRLICHHPAVDAVPGTGHYETICTYPNGGKDVEWVWDLLPVQAKEAWDEYEVILRFVPYTAEQLAAMGADSPLQRLMKLENVLGRLKTAMSGSMLLSALVSSIWPDETERED